MVTHDHVASDGEEWATQSHAHSFVVRLWVQETATGRDYRGTVQDVVSRAFCNFQDWSNLTAFMIARMDENERAQAGGTKGGTAWLSEEQR